MLNQSSLAIAGLLWDRDVIPETQTREEANKGEQRPTERRSWARGGWVRGSGGGGVVAPQGSLTKKTCRDDPQMAAEKCQRRCFREPQIGFCGRGDCVKPDRRREVEVEVEGWKWCKQPRWAKVRFII